MPTLLGVGTIGENPWARKGLGFSALTMAHLAVGIQFDSHTAHRYGQKVKLFQPPSPLPIDLWVRV